MSGVSLKGQTVGVKRQHVYDNSKDILQDNTCHYAPHLFTLNGTFQSRECWETVFLNQR